MGRIINPIYEMENKIHVPNHRPGQIYSKKKLCTKIGAATALPICLPLKSLGSEGQSSVKRPNPLKEIHRLIAYLNLTAASPLHPPPT